MKSNAFRIYGVQLEYPSRKCWRCTRTIACCGDDHYFGVDCDHFGNVELHRVCCFCVVELRLIQLRVWMVLRPGRGLCPIVSARHPPVATVAA